MNKEKWQRIDMNTYESRGITNANGTESWSFAAYEKDDPDDKGGKVRVRRDMMYTRYDAELIERALGDIYPRVDDNDKNLLESMVKKGDEQWQGNVLYTIFKNPMSYVTADDDQIIEVKSDAEAKIKLMEIMKETTLPRMSVMEMNSYLEADACLYNPKLQKLIFRQNASGEVISYDVTEDEAKALSRGENGDFWGRQYIGRFEKVGAIYSTVSQVLQFLTDMAYENGWLLANNNTYPQDDPGEKPTFVCQDDRLTLVIPGKGRFIADISTASEYPGIDIEFVSDDDNGQTVSRPRVLFEYPEDGKLRALVWNKTAKEDYCEEVPFEEVV